MKKIILIPMLIFSLFLFSQESDTKNENIRLETKNRITSARDRCY